MTRIDLLIRNWQEAEALLDLRNRQGRRYAKLGNNVYLEPRAEGCIAVKYHQTDIVTYYPDGKIKLCCGGWWTATTKQNLSAFSPFGVHQEQGVWYVNKNIGSFVKENIVEFKDGMILDTPTWVAGPPPAA